MLSVRGIYENGHVSLLEPVPYLKKINVIVTLLDESDKTGLTKQEMRIAKTPRPIGLAKDIFQVPESFFDELPEDVLDAFEGKEETVIVSDFGSIIMIDQEKWNDVMETIRLLKDKKSLKALMEGHRSRDEGKCPD